MYIYTYGENDEHNGESQERREQVQREVGEYSAIEKKEREWKRGS